MGLLRRLPNLNRRVNGTPLPERSCHGTLPPLGEDGEDTACCGVVAMKHGNTVGVRGQFDHRRPLFAVPRIHHRPQLPYCLRRGRELVRHHRLPLPRVQASTHPSLAPVGEAPHHGRHRVVALLLGVQSDLGLAPQRRKRPPHVLQVPPCNHRVKHGQAETPGRDLDDGVLAGGSPRPHGAPYLAQVPRAQQRGDDRGGVGHLPRILGAPPHVARPDLPCPHRPATVHVREHHLDGTHGAPDRHRTFPFPRLVRGHRLPPRAERPVDAFHRPPLKHAVDRRRPPHCALLRGPHRARRLHPLPQGAPLHRAPLVAHRPLPAHQQ